jgi:hypothetical protein
MKINISGQAKPGVYYADVIMSQGSNRWDAEGAAQASIQPKTSIRMQIDEKIVEQAELSGFAAAKEVFLEVPVRLEFKVRNAGSGPIEPVGSVRIFDRRGEEADMIEIGGKTIAPEGTEIYPVEWIPKQGFGRFKAKLMLNYGSENVRDLQDTLYFWFLPKPYLVLFFLGISFSFMLLITASLIGRKKPSKQRPAPPQQIQ